MLLSADAALLPASRQRLGASCQRLSAHAMLLGASAMPLSVSATLFGAGAAWLDVDARRLAAYRLFASGSFPGMPPLLSSGRRPKTPATGAVLVLGRRVLAKEGRWHRCSGYASITDE